MTDTDSSNIWRKIFWRMVTVFHYTPVNAKQFDELNIDVLAGKCQKHQNFPRQFCAIQYIMYFWMCLYWYWVWIVLRYFQHCMVMTKSKHRSVMVITYWLLKPWKLKPTITNFVCFAISSYCQLLLLLLFNNNKQWDGKFELVYWLAWAVMITGTSKDCYSFM